MPLGRAWGPRGRRDGELRTRRLGFPQRAHLGGVQTQLHAAALSHARGICITLPRPRSPAWPGPASRAAPTRGIPAFASAPASLGPRTPRPLPPPRVSLARPRANVGSRLAAAPVALTCRDISALGGGGWGWLLRPEGEGRRVQKVGAPVSGGGGRVDAGCERRVPGSGCWRVTGAERRPPPQPPPSRSPRDSIPGGPQLPSRGRERKVGVTEGAGGRACGRAPGDLRGGSCSERRGGRPNVGRGRVRGGRAEGVPGRARPPGGSRRPVPGGEGRAGPRRPLPSPGPQWRAAAWGRPDTGGRGQLSAGVRNSQRPPPGPGYLWAGGKVALPLRRPPRLRSGARRLQLAAGRRLAGGRGVRPGACGSPALEGVETGRGGGR